MREYDVLYTLSKRDGPIRARELNKQVLLSQPALSRLLDRLAERALSQGELINRENLAKSLVAARDLPAGTVVAEADVAVKSPGQGLSPLKMPGRYLVAIAQTAEYLLQQLTGGSRTEEWAKLGPACCDLLGLDDAGLAEICREAEPLLHLVE